MTTRPPRPGEIDGIDFRFVASTSFARCSTAASWPSGPPCTATSTARRRAPLEAALADGRDVLLDIDTQGAAQLRERYPEAVLIFILAPSMRELEQRLRERRSDAEPEIARRLVRAREEIALWRRYDYLIVNRDVKEAMDQLESIIHGRALPDGALGLTFPDLEVPN